MHYEDGSTFPIPGTWFEPVGVTDYVCLKKDNKEFLNNRGGGVPQGEVAMPPPAARIVVCPAVYSAFYR